MSATYANLTFGREDQLLWKQSAVGTDEQHVAEREVQIPPYDIGAAARGYAAWVSQVQGDRLLSLQREWRAAGYAIRRIADDIMFARSSSEIRQLGNYLRFASSLESALDRLLAVEEARAVA